MTEVAVEAWAPCLLCDDLVTKDNVMDHLMAHDKVNMAVVLSLLMFLEDESTDGGPTG